MHIQILVPELQTNIGPKTGKKHSFWVYEYQPQKSDIINLYLKVACHRFPSHMLIMNSWNFIIYLFHIKKINLLLTVQLNSRVPDFKVSSTSHTYNNFIVYPKNIYIKFLFKKSLKGPLYIIRSLICIIHFMLSTYIQKYKSGS